MRPVINIALLLALPLIHGCSGGKSEDSKVTQTQMDDIDNVQGTISDDMINTDESTDIAPVDAAPVEVATPSNKVAAKPVAKTLEAKPVVAPTTAPAPAAATQ